MCMELTNRRHPTPPQGIYLGALEMMEQGGRWLNQHLRETKTNAGKHQSFLPTALQKLGSVDGLGHGEFSCRHGVF